MVRSLILREELQTLLSAVACHTDNFKRSHEMDVSNKNIMFNLFLTRRSVDVLGAVSSRSLPDLDGIPVMEFWCLLSGGAGLR